VKAIVLDASAVLAMFFAEPGMEQVGNLFEEAAAADRPLLIGAINWAEVLGVVERKQGRSGVEAALRFERTMPLTVAPLDRDLAENAAALKAAHNLGWADACAAALAKHHKAVLVTGDKEFQALEGGIKISWLK